MLPWIEPCRQFHGHRVDAALRQPVRQQFQVGRAGTKLQTTRAMMSTQTPETKHRHGRQAPRTGRPPRPAAYASIIIASSWDEILGPSTGSRSFIPGRQGLAIREFNPARRSADLFRTAPRLFTQKLGSASFLLSPAPPAPGSEVSQLGGPGIFGSRLPNVTQPDHRSGNMA